MPKYTKKNPKIRKEKLKKTPFYTRREGKSGDIQYVACPHELRVGFINSPALLDVMGTITAQDIVVGGISFKDSIGTPYVEGTCQRMASLQVDESIIPPVASGIGAVSAPASNDVTQLKIFDSDFAQSPGTGANPKGVSIDIYSPHLSAGGTEGSTIDGREYTRINPRAPNNFAYAAGTAEGAVPTAGTLTSHATELNISGSADSYFIPTNVVGGLVTSYDRGPLFVNTLTNPITKLGEQVGSVLPCAPYDGYVGYQAHPLGGAYPGVHRHRGWAVITHRSPTNNYTYGEDDDPGITQNYMKYDHSKYAVTTIDEPWLSDEEWESGSPLFTSADARWQANGTRVAIIQEYVPVMQFWVPNKDVKVLGATVEVVASIGWIVENGGSDLAPQITPPPENGEVFHAYVDVYVAQLGEITFTSSEMGPTADWSTTTDRYYDSTLLRYVERVPYGAPGQLTVEDVAHSQTSLEGTFSLDGLPCSDASANNFDRVVGSHRAVARVMLRFVGDGATRIFTCRGRTSIAYSADNEFLNNKPVIVSLKPVRDPYATGAGQGVQAGLFIESAGSWMCQDAKYTDPYPHPGALGGQGCTINIEHFSVLLHTEQEAPTTVEAE